MLNRSQLNAISGNLELLFDRISSEADGIASNPRLRELLQASRTPSQVGSDLSFIADVNAILSDYVLKFNKQIYYVEIVEHFDSPAYRISTGEDVYSSRLRSQEITRLLDGRNDGWRVQSDLEPNFTRQQNDKGLLYFVHVQDPGRSKPLGTLVVHLRQSIWEDVFADIKLGIQLVSSNGSFIYQHGETPEGVGWIDRSPPIDKLLEGDFVLNENEERYYVSMLSTVADWHLAGFIEANELSLEWKSLFRQTLIIGVLCLLVVMLFSSFVSNRLTLPLLKIEWSVSKIIKGKDQFQQRVRVDPSRWKRLLTRRIWIVLLYGGLISIPVAVLLLSLTAEAERIIEKQTANFYSNKLEWISYKIQFEMDNHRQLLTYFFGNTELNRLMANLDKESISGVSWRNEVAKLTGNVTELSSGITGITLLDRYKRPVYSEGCIGLENAQRLATEDIPDQLYTGWAVISTGCGSSYVNMGARLVALDNYSKASYYEPIGYLFLHFNEFLLQQAYASAEDPQLLLFIVDRNGEVVSHQNKLLLGQSLDLVRSRTDDRIFVSRAISFNDWKAVMGVPMSLAIEPIERMRVLSSSLLILQFLIIGLLFYHYLSLIIVRIKRLIAVMNQAATGDNDVRLTLKTGDEMERLADGFNVMMERLSELMEDNYQQGLKRREAEFVALQAQINPHFLYNTLESINWEALRMTRGQNKISDMVTALSDLLRFSINKGNEIVTFEDEFNHLRNYLFIQQERYNDKFDVAWDIAPEVLSCRTVKLILQPLVENAIYHGLEEIDDNGLISIRGRVREEGILIEIMDNGAGIPDERLQQIRYSIRDWAESPSTGIGVRNVHERIQLYFGRSYGIAIHSIVDIGTTIQIRLPVITSDNSDQSAK